MVSGKNKLENVGQKTNMRFWLKSQLEALILLQTDVHARVFTGRRKRNECDEREEEKRN